MLKVYSGIGARNTPLAILDVMEKVGEDLALQGYILRSGGAQGADSAFERGSDLAGGRKEVMLPWASFNGKTSSFLRPPEEAFRIAATVHPNWMACSGAVKKLHARNAQIILGANLDSPSRFVVCFTELGEIKGGTGIALRIAHRYAIPVINFGSLPAKLETVRQVVRRLCA